MLNGNWRLLRNAITLISPSLSYCPLASIYQPGPFRLTEKLFRFTKSRYLLSLVTMSFKAAQYRLVSAALKGDSKEKGGCAQWWVGAHLDAHLADRTTVGVWIVLEAAERGRCWGWCIMRSRIVHTTGPVPQS